MTAKSYPVQRHVPVTVNIEVPPPPGSCYLSRIFKHSDTKLNLKNIVDPILGGARLLRPPPPLLIRYWPGILYIEPSLQ